MNNPITSYGIALLSKRDGKRVLLIGERISSLQYLDIFNTRCPISKVETYVSKCTPFEREMLAKDNFDDIYYDGFDAHRNYRELSERWHKIRPFVQSSLKNKETTEPCCMYSLPKGKKKYGETPEDAAIREFEEETRIDRKCIRSMGMEPFTINYRGSDDKYYQNVFYFYECDEPIEVAKTTCPSPFPSRQERISEEMKELHWVPIDQVGEYLDKNIVDNVKWLL